ncbi:hypothetical protein HY572_01150 [Candidatus Micrarchaeota archaeon]|nr:hypothetical protein [Candidatus Micrarchaeota archaeon]
MEACILCKQTHAPAEGHCQRLMELERRLNEIDGLNKAKFQALPPRHQQDMHEEVGRTARELDGMRSGELHPRARGKAEALRRLAGLLIAWTAEFRTREPSLR